MPIEPVSIRIPVERDVTGTVRIRDTRITLDNVVEAYLEHQSVEDIIKRFPELQPRDVYLVIGYYLHPWYKSEVDVYLMRRQTSHWARRQRQCHTCGSSERDENKCLNCGTPLDNGDANFHENWRTR
jgi:uncharacterized protein (DUF433 family)